MGYGHANVPHPSPVLYLAKPHHKTGVITVLQMETNQAEMWLRELKQSEWEN